MGGVARWGVTFRARLEPEAQRLGLPVSARQWGAVERLAGLWLQYGRALNLTGAKDEESLAPHVAQGFEAVACGRGAGAPLEGPWVDVGSGAGLPGLLFGVFVDQPVLLVEPRAKRASFLELGMAAIGRDPRDVIRARLERSTWNGLGADGTERLDPGGFALVSARAVFAPDRWLELARHWVCPGGVVLVHVDSDNVNAPSLVPIDQRSRVRAYKI